MRLLEDIVARPGAKIAQLELLGREERQQILQGWNATEEQRTAGETLPALFEAQASATPERIAVIDGEWLLRYGELNAQANRLAHYLIVQGIGAESLVAICVERGIDSIWRPGLK